jgi:hypothetical protein
MNINFPINLYTLLVFYVIITYCIGICICRRGLKACVHYSRCSDGYPLETDDKAAWTFALIFCPLWFPFYILYKVCFWSLYDDCK